MFILNRLALGFVIILSTLVISSCATEDLTGDVVKPTLTDSKGTDTKEVTLENSKTTGGTLSLFDTIRAALTRTRSDTNRDQQLLSNSNSPNFDNKQGEWIFLKNGTSETHCLDADYNGDLMVTIPDLAIYGGYYLNRSIEADLDYDGNVTLSDFALFGSYYNNCDYSTNQSDTWCIDTDGGLNYFVQGTVTNYNHQMEFTDYCVDPDIFSDIVREFYCLPNGTLTMTDYNCSQYNGSIRCYDGECKQV